LDERSTNQQLLAGWQSGSQQAATVLVERYLVRLTALVRARLSRRLARRVDPDDIVLSAWRSFFFAASNGRASPDGEGELWPLLATITLRKLSRQTCRQHAERRSLEREAVDSAAALAVLPTGDPTPEDAIAIADEVEMMLGRLEGIEREVFVRRLRGESTLEISRALKCSDRTVRRAGERIRAAIESNVDVQLSEAAPQPPDGGDRVTRRPPQCNLVDGGPATEERRHDSRVPTIALSDLLMQQMVGEGGFGKVYRARFQPTGETVAVKFLRKRLWSDRRAVDTLLSEAEILELLSHPGIVRGRGWGMTSYGAVFLVTELVNGENLGQWVARTNPSARAILDAVAQVAETVAAAHRSGVLHCDLKPSNVIRELDGRVVLTDFGFARRLADPVWVPAVGGTAGFLAPEQVSDVFGLAGPHTDVYGLGAILYVLLTGRPPTIGCDAAETLARVISSEAPPAASRLQATVPATIDRVIARCLAKEPYERYDSATSVARELRLVAASD
jgi:DNA-directed RNA polymerase specialized sigma24 family protein/predicted Ser/Thr protein kinase